MTKTKKNRDKSTALARISHIYDSLRLSRPATKKHLKNYIKIFLNLNIPDRRICPEHNSPLDYLWHSFNADFAGPKKPNADAIIWANRAGGKTQLAAVATLLDSVFKPGCQTRILAGSAEQAQRMYEYLTSFLPKGYENLLAESVKKDSCTFSNGSAVELLTQSHTSVRGQHIQKLRCDEVELFDEDVFRAAQFTTISKNNIVPAIESISTMHRPYGLMHKIVTGAKQRNVPVFKWCIWETIEKCTNRNCSQCPLNSDCQGRAKKAVGYLKIDDVITAMKRSSRAAWQSEMLCQRPSLENIVFDEFDSAVNVKPLEFNPSLALYRTIDFGFVNPFVCLWIQTDSDNNVYVIDEYVRSRVAIDAHADEIKKRTPVSEEKVAATFCDPSGSAANDVTGTSAVRSLNAHGIRTRFRRSSIIAGIELIRRAIRSGDGRTSLFISPRCPRLIEALQCYHYPENAADAGRELPLKDGVYDHPIDALRYFFINHTRPAKAFSRKY